MRVHVLGSAGSYPAPGRACSSYLVQSKNASLLIDAGNGSMSNLFAFTTPDRLDAVFLSHSHVDHIADFVGIFHFRLYGSKPQSPLLLICPNSVVDKLKGLISDASLERAVKILSTETVESTVVGDLLLSWLMVAHPTPTYGIRVVDQGSGGVFGYSADSGPCEALEQIAERTDLFLCEATWLPGGEHRPLDLHLDVHQAVDIAQRSSTKLLVLTHVAYPQSPFEALHIAKQYCLQQAIDIAYDLGSFEVYPPAPLSYFQRGLPPGGRLT